MNWSERAKTALRESRLREPKTKIAKLRSILPELEVILDGGHSQSDCMDFLKRQGLVFNSLVGFRMALSRARKMGPLGGAITSGGSSRTEPNEPTKNVVSGTEYGVKSEGNTVELSERVDKPSDGTIVIERVDGVLRTSTTKRNVELNATPKLKDFI